MVKNILKLAENIAKKLPQKWQACLQYAKNMPCYVLNFLPEVKSECGLPLELELDVVGEHPLLLVHPLHPQHDVRQ